MDTNAVWMDARQMMTTRSSDTQTQTSSQDTQPGWLPHTPWVDVHITQGHVPPATPPSTQCQELDNSKQTQTGDRGEHVRLKSCSASSNLAGRKAQTRPCMGSCEASMDTLLSGYPPAASPNSHSSG